MYAIAFISGGKDSILALHLASLWGLKILEVIYMDPNSDLIDTDSYMFQTIGSEITKIIIKDCLPQFNGQISKITGKSLLIDSLKYKETDGDEVEDLYNILEKVHDKHEKKAKFVITGAILSNYQRYRVENCCVRLGLTSFAPLWGLEQRLLLGFFNSWHDYFDVKIVKTACIGLDPTDLALPIKNLCDKLLLLKTKYGLNVCGEGGEFETITFKAPLFKKIIFAEFDSICDESGDVCYAKLKGSVILKENPHHGIMKFKLPILHTCLSNIDNVTEAALLTLSKFSERKIELKNVFVSDNEEIEPLKLLIDSSSISSQIQYLITNCLVGYDNEKNLIISDVHSFDSTLQGVLHCLVQIRNLISHLTDDEIHSYIFSNTHYFLFKFNSKEIYDQLNQQVTDLALKFQQVNYFWRHNNQICYIYSVLDSFLNINESPGYIPEDDMEQDHTAKMQKLVEQFENPYHMEKVYLNFHNKNSWQIESDVDLESEFPITLSVKCAACPSYTPKI